MFLSQCTPSICHSELFPSACPSIRPASRQQLCTWPRVPKPEHLLSSMCLPCQGVFLQTIFPYPLVNQLQLLLFQLLLQRGNGRNRNLFGLEGQMPPKGRFHPAPAAVCIFRWIFPRLRILHTFSLSTIDLCTLSAELPWYTGIAPENLYHP